MEIQEIVKRVDHTLLNVDATFSDVKNLCDEGILFGTASVCISPCYVKKAAEYTDKKIPICTVIGFPNGATTTAAKVYETQDALKNGASEIDMVINIGALKEKRYADILNEIKQIKEVCGGNILKVIIETCLLSDQEKIIMCNIVGQAGADYIKTSTGFSTGGATREDVALFKANVPDGLKIKAAGGIKTLQDAKDFINLGADRLGTSRIVKLAKGLNTAGY